MGAAEPTTNGTDRRTAHDLNFPLDVTAILRTLLSPSQSPPLFDILAIASRPQVHAKK